MFRICLYELEFLKNLIKRNKELFIKHHIYKWMPAGMHAYGCTCVCQKKSPKLNNKEMLWKCLFVKAFSLPANILILSDHIVFSIMYRDVVSWWKVDAEDQWCPNCFVSEKIHCCKRLVWYIFMQIFYFPSISVFSKLFPLFLPMKMSNTFSKESRNFESLYN